jgi:hypothetical protein
MIYIDAIYILKNHRNINVFSIYLFPYTLVYILSIKRSTKLAIITLKDKENKFCYYGNLDDA